MKFKRVLSVLLVAVMLMGILPTFSVANAATYGDLTYEISDGEVTITDCSESAISVAIPSEIDGYPVTSIGYRAFYDCRSLTSITIPDGVTSIGDYAFCVCVSLASITIPDSVTAIGKYAFEFCNRLESITLPDSVTTISHGAFWCCENLVSITIGNSVTTIGEYAFEHCLSLERITIPDSVTTIGDSAFYKCESLKSITLPDGLTSIGEHAFMYCRSFANITIPDSVTSIADYTFRYCTSLTSITIPDGLTSIGEYAFDYCTSLETVNYGGSEQDRVNITIGSDNSPLLNATWNYNTYFYGDTSDITYDSSKYIVKVVNSSGAPIAGAKVKTISLNSESTYTTDEDGYVIFAKNFTLSDIDFTVTAEGYEGYTTVGKNYKISGNGIEVFTLYTPAEAGLMLTEAIYQDTNSSYNEVLGVDVNLVKGTKRLSMSNSGLGYFRVLCTTSDTSRVKGYTMYQNGKIVKTSENGVFNLRIKDFNAGANIYVTVFGNAGEKVTTPLNLEICDDSAVADASVSFGNSIAISVPDTIPFVGGSTVNYKIPELPITFKLEDGKLYAGLNVNLTDDKSIKEQFEELKTLMEDVRKLSNYKVGKNLKGNITKFLKKRDKFNLPVAGDVEAMLFGGGEATWSDDGLETIELQAYFLVDASLEKNWQTMVSVVPVTIQIKVGVEGKLQAAIEWDFKNKVMNGDVELNIKPYLNAFGGVGVGKFIGVGVYGDADVDFAIQLFGTSITPGLNSIDLTGELGLKAYAGPFTYKKSFAHNTWHLYTRTDAVSHSLSYPSYYESLYDSGNYAVDDVSYLQEQSEWLGEWSSNVSTFALRNAVTSMNINPLIENTYRNMQPSVATTDDSAVMVFLGGDTSRDAQNISVLMYSVYNADFGTWSEPVKVDGNNTADASPMLYTDGETIRLVYQDASKVYDENLTAAEYLSTQNVVAYVYDNDTNTFVLEKTFESDDMQYRAPKLTTVNDTPTVVWVAGENCDILGQGDDNTFLYSSYSNGAWIEPSVLAGNICSVADYAVGTSDNQLNVLYIADEDNNFATEQDRKLMLSNGQTVATGSVSDLDFVKLSSEENKSFIWCADGTLNTLNESGDVIAVCTVGSPESVSVLDDKILFTTASKDENGNANSEVFAVVYDEATDSYGSAVQLSNQEKYIERIDAADFNGQELLVMTRKSVEISEDDVTDNCELAWAVLSDSVDLRIDDVEYRYDDIADNELPLYVSFTNCGTDISDGCEISVQDQNGDTVHTLVYEQAITSGETKDVTVMLPLENVTELTEYYVVVGNDSYAFDIGHADLSVSTESIKVGDQNTLVCTVTNKGLSPASGDLILYDGTSENMLSKETFESIAPGNRLTFVFDLDSINSENIITCEVESDTEDYLESNNTESVYFDFSEFNEIACQHEYDDDCDATCNGCDYTRTAPHSWGEYVYNDDATELADGTKTSICEACGELNTITAEGTKLSYFESGSGTADDPYIVSSKRHFNNVRYFLDANFKLVSNIEFTEADFAEGGAFYNDGKGFLPFGTSSTNSFKGTFDGNGHHIKNLQINVSTTSSVYSGMFAYNKGTIKNLGIVDGNVTLSAANIRCGGIVGYNISGTVTNCFFDGSISVSATSSAYVGGIVGQNIGTITDCYNNSDVDLTTKSSVARVGGISGNNGKTISNCYNTGVITGVSTSSTAYVGAIVGDASKVITNCYYLDNMSVGVGKGTDAAICCTDDQMKLQSTFAGFDFENTWTFDNKVHEYPILKQIHYYHVFTDACDTTCNICSYTRIAEHSWGEYIYNESGAAETRTCTSCGESETRDITENPTYRPDSHMPFVTLNDAGNGVVLDHNKSWATRVYWGCIGDTQVEYKWFDEDFRLLCGTDYFADYSPKAGETYNFTKPGWYRFVVKGIRTGTTVEDYTYSELVFDFYYDGSVAPTVPTITELGNNQVKINTNGTAIKKFYYGNIGQTNVPYSWFNSFWGTALGTKTYTPVFDNRDGRIITLQTKGYYNIIIVDTNNNEYIYTVYADQTAPVIKKADGESKAIVDIDLLKGNVGTKATMTKLYYGYLGTEDKEISTWDEFTTNVPKRVAASNVAQGTTFNLANKGYYKFYAVMALSNGRTIEVVYTVDNN